MKALIIENEIPSARRLQRMLLNFEIEILEVLSSVKQSVKWFEQNEQPDLVFLDVHLADGLCFEIFKHINISSKIIFTTAYSQYSIKAFDYNSFSYLLKPIKKELLKFAIEKAKVFVENDNDLQELKKMVLIENGKKYKNSFAVTIGTKIKIIKTSEIVCFYSANNATFIKTIDFVGLVNYSLNSLEDTLNPTVFFRVNRTYILNKTTVKTMKSYVNSRLKIDFESAEEKGIIVSRDRVKEFKKWIQ